MTSAIDIKQAAALLLLGIAIGCAVSHFYFAGFLADRAADGTPIAIGGKLYDVQVVDRGGLDSMVNSETNSTTLDTMPVHPKH